MSQPNPLPAPTARPAKRAAQRYLSIGADRAGHTGVLRLSQAWSLNAARELGPYFEGNVGAHGVVPALPSRACLGALLREAY